MNEMLKNLGEKARMAEASVRGLSTNKKNQVLKGVAEKLLSDQRHPFNSQCLRCKERQRKTECRKVW